MVDRNVHLPYSGISGGQGSFSPVDLGPAQADDIDDFWERVWLEVDYDAVTESKGFLRARVRVP